MPVFIKLEHCNRAWMFTCIHVSIFCFVPLLRTQSCWVLTISLLYLNAFRLPITHTPVTNPWRTIASTQYDVIASPTTEPSHTPHIPFGESSHPPLSPSQTRTPLITQRTYPWRSMAPTWAGDIARYLLREISSTPSWWCHRAPWWRQSIGGRKRWMN